MSETLVFDTWPRESSSAIVAALNGFPRAQFPRGCVTNPLRIAVTAAETAAVREPPGVSETLVFDTRPGESSSAIVPALKGFPRG